MLCSCKSLIIFAKELFSIGQSAGSIFSEAIGLFRTFQRISATRTFSASFSSECYKMFKWAVNIFEAIRSVFFFTPLDDIQLFFIFVCVIPLAIIFFITAEASGYLFFEVTFLCVLGAAFGVGIGYFGIDLNLALILTFVIGFFCFLVTTLVWDERDQLLLCDVERRTYDLCCKQRLRFKNTFSLTTTLTLITAILIPIFFDNYNLGKLYFIACMIIVIIFFLIEILYISLIIGCEEIEDDEDYEVESIALLISFALQLYPLIIVPASEYFVIIIQNDCKNDWRIIVGYVFFSLLLPLSLTVFMIYFGQGVDLFGKYKEGIYSCIEVVDIIKQVVYAIVASFDIPWACVGIEIAWIILIFGLRPFTQISEYVLQAGNSLIIIIETVVCIVVSHRGNGFLNFALSVTFVVLACIPAVAGLYVYFIFDFDPDDDDSCIDERMEASIKLLPVFRFFSPVAAIFFGIVYIKIFDVNQLIQ